MNNMKYEELKITGPPMYKQGSIDVECSDQWEGCNDIASLPLVSSRTALLVVDVQPEYWSDCPAVRKDFPNFPSRVSSLVKHCRSQSAQCIWVRAEYSFEKSPWLQQFARLHKGRIPPEVKASSRWEKFAEPAPGEHIISKSSWSSTSDTQLLDVLRDAGIDTVLVCGLITSVCVQHSAFGLFEAGFRTILVTDACADRGMARHEAALALYGGYMYELQTVENLKTELKSENPVIVSGTFTANAKSSGAMSTKSESTGSLTTLDSCLSDDEEVESAAIAV